MKTRVLPINHVNVTAKAVVYMCYGLGSCIGLFVTDRATKLAGGAHIPVPSSLDTDELLGAPLLIDKLLQAFQQQGSDLSCLRAKITGGAQVYESSSDIGKQNIEAVRQVLVDKKIFIAAADVGGTVSRTARFNSMTGELKISTSGQMIYSI
jgi:chemotaxis protein CheD